MELLSHKPDYKGRFGDKRLAERAKLLSQSLFFGKTSSIHGSTRNESEQKGFYRFLANERITEQELIAELSQRCGANVKGRNVIVIQDSSSIGLSEHSGHIKPGSGVGLVGNKTGLGFLTHVSLVLDADRETMLGYSDVQLWHRTEDKSNNTTQAYKRQSIEQKESYKWIKASLQAKEQLSTAQSITIIQDREGDIYEQFCLIGDAKTSLIIRNRDNRKLSDGSKLHERLCQASVLGKYQIAIYSDIRKEKVSRTATVEVKCIPVAICKPVSAKTKDIPKALTLYAIEVKETDRSVSHPVCWRLLTTEEITTYEQTITIVEKYKQRWYIEQLFRLLKKQGYQIEATQLENGWAIRKLFVLVLNAALRVMQLYLAYDREESQPTAEVFSEEEIRFLGMIEANHISMTEHTKNPFSKERLAWASWIIARLGGWKGNSKQRKAGPILLKTGLDKFELMYQGWKLAQLIT